MGNYFRSPKYLEVREKWARTLHEKCNGLVKHRTISSNYAPSYAAMEYLYTAFRLIIIYIVSPLIFQSTGVLIMSLAIHGRTLKTGSLLLMLGKCRFFMSKQVG